MLRLRRRIRTQADEVQRTPPVVPDSYSNSRPHSLILRFYSHQAVVGASSFFEEFYQIN